jgi:hypothetical protein
MKPDSEVGGVVNIAYYHASKFGSWQNKVTAFADQIMSTMRIQSG